ncbi:MAG: flagellar motor switch protein FliM [Oscillospiraceae bacterium]|nr:flagellar motor switch protein FliM [Oscillospiraceae bacterium]
MSQEEIDQYIRSMTGGGGDDLLLSIEEDEPDPAAAAEPAAGGFVPSARSEPRQFNKKFTIYDFKNPKIFSKDQMRQIELIYDNYAKRLSSFISGRLRTECTININGIEEMRYIEYNNALPESIMMGVLETPPLEGNMLVEISEETAYLIIEKLLGWTGDKPIVSDGDFTDIEIKICEKFFTEISGYLKEAWANVTDMEPRLDRIETNARLAQIMPLNDMIILIMFDLKMNEYEGRLQICVPCLNLAELLDQAENYMKIKRKAKDEDIEKTKKDIFENLKTSKVDVCGVLGNATLSLQELLYMQIGDVLPLDSVRNSPITLTVGNLDWYKGEIGIKKNRVAVKIISELRAKKELQKIL